MTELPDTLFSTQPAPIVENASGKGGVVLICEHAGQLLPESLGSLGLDIEAMSTHIAWDIGAAGLARALSKQLDAPLIMQRYSRLVFDCNRVIEAPDAIVGESDGVEIPDNQQLSATDRQLRFDQVYTPFEQAIKKVIDDCLQQGTSPAIVSIHSFTPVFKGQQRSLDLGIIHDPSDAAFAAYTLELGRQSGQYSVELNQPYEARDGVTHTLQTHGVRRKLSNVMFEVRNDLVSDTRGQAQWAARLESLISGALKIEAGKANVTNI
jgi:predicted N-formylglutamate amidohydrolase